MMLSFKVLAIIKTQKTKKYRLTSKTRLQQQRKLIQVSGDAARNRFKKCMVKSRTQTKILTMKLTVKLLKS